MHTILLYHFTLKSPPHPLSSSHSPNLVVSSHLFLFSLLGYLWRKNNLTSYNQPSFPPNYTGSSSDNKKKVKTEKSFFESQSSHTPHSDTRHGKEEENKTGKRKGLWEKYAYTNAIVSELICLSEENYAKFSGQMAQWLRALAALTEDLCLVPASLWWLKTLIISFCSEQIWDPLLACTYTAGKKCSYTSK